MQNIKAYNKIQEACKKLQEADNNLRYIKALKSILFWLLRYDQSLTQEEKETDIYYYCFFCAGAGFSFFDKINNSIIEYNYNIKPF